MDLTPTGGAKISGKYKIREEEKKTGNRDKKRRVYLKEFKAEAPAPVEKREKPVRRKPGFAGFRFAPLLSPARWFFAVVVDPHVKLPG
jgi:hypothetical protein